MAKPISQLYYDNNKKEFVIESYAIESQWGWAVSFGKLQHLSYEEMKQKGLSIIQCDLQEFATRKKTNKSELESFSAAERSIFEHTQKNISICLLNSNTLRLTPMISEKNGHVGHSEDSICIELPTTEGYFFQMLIEVLSKC